VLLRFCRCRLWRQPRRSDAILRGLVPMIHKLSGKIIFVRREVGSADSQFCSHSRKNLLQIVDLSLTGLFRLRQVRHTRCELCKAMTAKVLVCYSFQEPRVGGTRLHH
jgi:hypothetical protein